MSCPCNYRRYDLQHPSLKPPNPFSFPRWGCQHTPPQGTRLPNATHSPSHLSFQQLTRFARQSRWLNCLGPLLKLPICSLSPATNAHPGDPNHQFVSGGAWGHLEKLGLSTGEIASFLRILCQPLLLCTPLPLSTTGANRKLSRPKYLCKFKCCVFEEKCNRATSEKAPAGCKGPKPRRDFSGGRSPLANNANARGLSPTSDPLRGDKGGILKGRSQ